MYLSDAITEYVGHRRNIGYARNTTRVEKQALELLLVTVGNIRCKSLTAQHGEMFVMAMSSRDFRPSTTNLYRGAFRRFCKWAAMKKYLPSTANPLGTTRNLVVSPEPRRRVHRRDFARLLDGCDHPQTRIIVALGLYLFLRASEVSHLDVEHVRLADGEILVYQPKTKRFHEMPICAELDHELRRWLTWYATDQATVNGALQPHWPLVPARTQGHMQNDGTGLCGGRPVLPEYGQMNPFSRAKQIHLKVHDALRNLGWNLKPGDREGVHTLRRSGARALFDDMVETGEVRDGVLRIVSAMLHHRSVTTTELYLGLEADRERVAALLKGRQMFHTGHATALNATLTASQPAPGRSPQLITPTPQEAVS